MMNIYSIYDSKAKQFASPFTSANDDLAKRIVTLTYDRVGDCDLSRYPDDFVVFRVGAFDDDNGVLIPLDAMESLGSVLQIVNLLHSAPRCNFPDQETSNE